jgi:hypothetical protein
MTTTFLVDIQTSQHFPAMVKTLLGLRCLINAASAFSAMAPASKSSGNKVFDSLRSTPLIRASDSSPIILHPTGSNSIIFALLHSYEHRIHLLSSYRINDEPLRPLASATKQPCWPSCVTTDDFYAVSMRQNFVTIFISIGTGEAAADEWRIHYLFKT